MNDTTTAQPTAMDADDDDEISLLDLAIALGEEKKTLFAFPAVFGAVAVAVSLIMTPIFTAKTVMMPPQQQQSGAASALASLGALAGIAGSAAGIKSPDEMYVAFLQSETLQNALIEKFKLKERYQKKTLLETREALKGVVKVATDKKSGLLTIEADDHDPAFAAELANAHVTELKNMLGKLAVTEAQQRRVFYEQQILKTQAELSKSEAEFRAAKEQSGLQVTVIIADAGVRAGADLRAQIAAKEIQIEALSRFATPQNPDLQRISSELAALRAQLAKIEQGTGGSDKATPTQQAAVKAYREIKAREAMMGVLTAQYEAARVDEAKEGPLVQQVDVATSPERRAKPKRALIVIIATLVGLFLGVLVAFVHQALRKAAHDPETAQRLSQLKRVWSLS
jgi:uncharacterized protein involved in exopolysaccharide biosynthesis